jgi:hypothetical protein
MDISSFLGNENPAYGLSRSYRCMNPVIRSKGWEWCRKFSNGATSVADFICDTGIFVGKLCKVVPNSMTNGFYTALNYNGFFSLPYLADLARKKFWDVNFARNTGCPKLAMFAFMTFIIQVNSVALIILGSFGATENQMGRPYLMDDIFSYTIPDSELAIGMNFCIMLIAMKIDWCTLKILDKRSYSGTEINTFFNILLDPVSQGRVNRDISKEVTMVRIGLGKDVLRRILENIHRLSESDERQILQIIRKDLSLQFRVGLAAMLALKVLGDLGMIVERNYPDSAISSGINLGFMLLYTARWMFWARRSAVLRDEILSLRTLSIN